MKMNSNKKQNIFNCSLLARFHSKFHATNLVVNIRSMGKKLGKCREFHHGKGVGTMYGAQLFGGGGLKREKWSADLNKMQNH